jgi:hypothetical protein
VGDVTLPAPGVVVGGESPGASDALVKLADGEPPGVAGELTRRWLANDRRAEEIEALGPGRRYIQGLSPPRQATGAFLARGRDRGGKVPIPPGGSGPGLPGTGSLLGGGVAERTLPRIPATRAQGDARAAEPLLPLVAAELRKAALSAASAGPSTAVTAGGLVTLDSAATQENRGSPVQKGPGRAGYRVWGP